jgi:hypothetical protein
VKSTILFQFLIFFASAELSLIFEKLRDQEKKLSEIQTSLASLRKISTNSTLQNASSSLETEPPTNVRFCPFVHCYNGNFAMINAFQ